MCTSAMVSAGHVSCQGRQIEGKNNFQDRMMMGGDAGLFQVGSVVYHQDGGAGLGTSASLSCSWYG